MAEPEVTPAVEPVVPIVEPVAPIADPVVAPVTETIYFNGDGTLVEGWQSTLPEGYREEKSLATVNDAKVLAKMFVDTKRMVGKNVIAVPDETSTEGEWQEYHKAGGRPETVADYNLKAPDGFPEEIKAQVFPEGRIEKWQERFFKGGVSQKAANAFIQEFTQDILADYQKAQQSKEAEMAGLTGNLATEWGAAFEQKKHLGNIAISEGTEGDDEFKARLVEKFGNDPDFIKYSSNLGEKFAEGKPPGFAAIPTPNDYQDQIDTLMEDPLYLNGTKQQRMKIVEKIMALRKLQKPEPVTT